MLVLSCTFALFSAFGTMFFDNPPPEGAHPSADSLLWAFAAGVGTLLIPLIAAASTRKPMGNSALAVRLLVCSAGYLVPFLIPTLDGVLHG